MRISFDRRLKIIATICSRITEKN